MTAIGPDSVQTQTTSCGKHSGSANALRRDQAGTCNTFDIAKAGDYTDVLSS